MKKIKEYLYRTFISPFYLQERAIVYDKAYDHAVHDTEKKFNERLHELNEQWLMDPTNILHVTERGIITLDGKEINAVELKNLKSEVATFKQFRLYQIFQETIKQKAIEKSVNQSINFEGVLSGKMMIHNLGIIKSIIDVIDNYKK